MTDMMSWDWNSVELAMPTDEPMVVTDETSRLVLSDGGMLWRFHFSKISLHETLHSTAASFFRL